MATIETALTRLLGIQHPILLAPMGSAAGGKLAAAVTHAGGLGMLGSGYASEAAIRKELAEAGNARIGIGFILWALDKNPQHFIVGPGTGVESQIENTVMPQSRDVADKWVILDAEQAADQNVSL